MSVVIWNCPLAGQWVPDDGHYGMWWPKGRFCDDDGHGPGVPGHPANRIGAERMGRSYSTEALSTRQGRPRRPVGTARFRAGPDTVMALVTAVVTGRPYVPNCAVGGGLDEDVRRGSG